MFAEPDRSRAVGVLLNSTDTGMNVEGPVMLGPIEFDATGDPRPDQPDQRGLDHVLLVKEIVAVGFILPDVDASAGSGSIITRINSFSR